MPLKRLTLPWDELNDNAYNGGKRLIRDLGKQAKGIACQLYRDTPGALIPNPASNFLTGMWDGICSDDPQGLPPPPQPEFEGGQCCDVKYIVTYTCTWTSCNGYQWGRINRDVEIWGKITHWDWEYDGTDFNVWLFGEHCDGSQSQVVIAGVVGSPPPVESCASPYGNAPDLSTLVVQIHNIVRKDGQPDTCGASPPKYDPPTTYIPPSGDIVIPTRPDGSGIDLTIPFAWIDADFNLDIKPYIDVGGIKINFDLGGINFEFDSDNPPPTYDPDVNPLPDTLFPPAPLPPPGWGDIQVDIDNTNNVVNDIDTKIDTKADKTDIPDYQDELDRIEDKIDNLPPPPPPLVPCATGKQNFVRVTANISNYIGKTVFTDDDNEIVVFGGYIRFLIDGEPYGEELPVRRLVHHFLMPPWATGYRLVPQNQVILSGVIVEKTVDLPEVTLLDCSGGTV